MVDGTIIFDTAIDKSGAIRDSKEIERELKEILKKRKTIATELNKSTKERNNLDKKIKELESKEKRTEKEDELLSSSVEKRMDLTDIIRSQKAFLEGILEEEREITLELEKQRQCEADIRNIHSTSKEKADNSKYINGIQDADKYQKALEEVELQLREVEEETRKLAKEKGLDPEQVLKADANYQKLKKKFTALTAESKRFTKETNKTEKSAKKIHKNTKPIPKEVAKAAKESKKLADNLGGSKMSGALSSLVNSFKSFGVAVAAAFSIKKIFQATSEFAKECLELAGAAQSAAGMMEIAFGNMSDDCEAFADSALSSFGMAEAKAKEYASTYKLMSSGMGINDNLAETMAFNATKRLADISYLRRIPLEEMDTRIKAIWTGETEAIKNLGVIMTEANLSAYALSRGIKKNFNDMTEAEKVALRYAFVMEKTKYAEDAFIEKQDTWVGQTQLLKETIAEFKAEIGASFIKVLTPSVKLLNNFLQDLIKYAKVLELVVGDLFFSNNESSMKEPIEELTDTQNEYTDSIEKAIDAQERQLASFDRLNQLTGKKSGTGTIDIESLVNLNLDEAKEEVSEVEEEVDKLYDKFKESDSYTTLDNIKNKFNEIRNSFKDFYDNHLSKFFNSFSTFGTEFGEFLDKSKILKALLWWLKEILTALVDVLTWLTNLLTLPIAMFNYATSTTPEEKEENANAIKESLKGFLGKELYDILWKLFKSTRVGVAVDYPTYQIASTKPKLATGTVVPANYGEFTAILGDNRREPEIVSPLSTMKQAVAEVLSEMGVEVKVDNHLYLDSDEVSNVVIKKHNQIVKRTGKTPLKGVKTT